MYTYLIICMHITDDHIDPYLIDIVRALGWLYVRLALSCHRLIVPDENWSEDICICADADVGRKTKAAAWRHPQAAKPRPPRPATKKPATKKSPKIVIPAIFNWPPISASTFRSASNSREQPSAGSANDVPAELIPNLSNASTPPVSSQPSTVSSLDTATQEQSCTSPTPIAQLSTPNHTCVPPSIHTHPRLVSDIPPPISYTHKSSPSPTSTSIPTSSSITSQPVTASSLATASQKQSSDDESAFENITSGTWIIFSIPIDKLFMMGMISQCWLFILTYLAYGDLSYQYVLQKFVDITNSLLLRVQGTILEL